MRFLGFGLATFAGLLLASDAVAQCGAGGCGAGRASSSMRMASSRYNGNRSMMMSQQRVAMNHQPQIIERIIRVPAEPAPQPAPQVIERQTIIREQAPVVIREQAPIVVQQVQPVLVAPQAFYEPVGVTHLRFGARGRLRGYTTTGPVGIGYGGPALLHVGPRGRAVIVR